ncbi:MAG: response regulator [Verrucomicrobiota bacterium]|nr:response regulator [Verrucomicrobiota bacterium]
MNTQTIKPAIILIVDDDPTVLRLLTAKLSVFKWITVIATADPQAAIALAVEKLPDLIVCDIDMNKMDGCEIAQRLQSQPATKAIPFIFLSSLVAAADVERNKGTIGGRRMISKQSPLDKIIGAIIEAVP